MGSGIFPGLASRPERLARQENAPGGRRGPSRRLLGREDGQALVEFALIAPLFLAVVFGIITFGIGLNFWLDMNRAANQGARQAVVNHWPPYCQRGETACTSSNSSTPCATVLATNSKARLQDVLRCQVRNSPTVTVCYPGKTPATATIGDPVRVKVTAPYTLFFMNSLGIDLTATAAMRLEQVPTLITNAQASCA